MAVAFAAGHGGFVGGGNFVGGAVLAHGGSVYPEDAMAESADLIELVADQDDGAASAGNVPHFPQAFLLEIDVADGQHLIHQQDFRLQMRGHGERQTDVHPRGIVLYGRVNEFFELGERHDLVKLAGDLTLAHPQDGPGEERVFAPGELRMEARADFQQRPDPPVNLRPSRRRPRDTGEDLQQRRFARPVPPDQAKYFSFFHFQRNVLQRPESLFLLAPERRKGRAQELLQGMAQAGMPLKAALVALPQPFPMDHRLIHSPKSLSFSPVKIATFCLDKYYSSVII